MSAHEDRIGPTRAMQQALGPSYASPSPRGARPSGGKVNALAAQVQRQALAAGVSGPEDKAADGIGDVVPASYVASPRDSAEQQPVLTLSVCCPALAIHTTMALRLTPPGETKGNATLREAMGRFCHELKDNKLVVFEQNRELSRASELLLQEVLYKRLEEWTSKLELYEAIKKEKEAWEETLTKVRAEHIQKTQALEAKISLLESGLVPSVVETHAAELVDGTQQTDMTGELGDTWPLWDRLLELGVETQDLRAGRDRLTEVLRDERAATEAHFLELHEVLRNLRSAVVTESEDRATGDRALQELFEKCVRLLVDRQRAFANIVSDLKQLHKMTQAQKGGLGEDVAAELQEETDTSQLTEAYENDVLEEFRQLIGPADWDRLYQATLSNAELHATRGESSRPRPSVATKVVEALWARTKEHAVEFDQRRAQSEKIVGVDLSSQTSAIQSLADIVKAPGADDTDSEYVESTHSESQGIICEGQSYAELLLERAPAAQTVANRWHGIFNVAKNVVKVIRSTTRNSELTDTIRNATSAFRQSVSKSAQPSPDPEKDDPAPLDPSMRTDELHQEEHHTDKQHGGEHRDEEYQDELNLLLSKEMVEIGVQVGGGERSQPSVAVQAFSPSSSVEVQVDLNDITRDLAEQVAVGASDLAIEAPSASSSFQEVDSFVVVSPKRSTTASATVGTMTPAHFLVQELLSSRYVRWYNLPLGSQMDFKWSLIPIFHNVDTPGEDMDFLASFEDSGFMSVDDMQLSVRNAIKLRTANLVASKPRLVRALPPNVLARFPPERAGLVAGRQPMHYISPLAWPHLAGMEVEVVDEGGREEAADDASLRASSPRSPTPLGRPPPPRTLSPTRPPLPAPGQRRPSSGAAKVVIKGQPAVPRDKTRRPSTLATQALGRDDLSLLDSRDPSKGEPWSPGSPSEASPKPKWRRAPSLDEDGAASDYSWDAREEGNTRPSTSLGLTHDFHMSVTPDARRGSPDRENEICEAGQVAREALRTPEAVVAEESETPRNSFGSFSGSRPDAQRKQVAGPAPKKGRLRSAPLARIGKSGEADFNARDKFLIHGGMRLRRGSIPSQ